LAWLGCTGAHPAWDAPVLKHQAWRNNMYQDTFVVTDDGRTKKLTGLYATLLAHHLKCEELFAAIKQAKGERVAMHTAQYPPRELAFEVAHLRMIVEL
jgi:hypothetical protein